MPADIILYALIAAGLIFWLNNILGNKNGNESDRPTSFSSDEKSEPPLKPIINDKSENVVSLNTSVGDQFALPRHVNIENKTTENMLLELAEEHDNFDLEHFTGGVADAFAIVVESFADGDKETLKELLDKPVYKAFASEIDARKKRKESVTTQIQSVRQVSLIEAKSKKDIIYLTARITAQEICVIRDDKDEIISGNPDKVTEMVDVWVFGFDTKTEGPEWLVYETRDDEIEDHKTPLPDSSK